MSEEPGDIASSKAMARSSLLHAGSRAGPPLAVVATRLGPARPLVGSLKMLLFRAKATAVPEALQAGSAAALPGSE